MPDVRRSHASFDPMPSLQAYDSIPPDRRTGMFIKTLSGTLLGNDLLPALRCEGVVLVGRISQPPPIH